MGRAALQLFRVLAPGFLAVVLGLAIAVVAADAGAAATDSLTRFKVPAAAAPHKRAFLRVAREIWGLRVPAALGMQIQQESGWRDGLKSSAGARGICQFMAATAAGLEAQAPGLSSLGRYSPPWCYRAHNLLMHELYGGYSRATDPCNAFKFALSGYNGGPLMLRREMAICAADESIDCDPGQWSENVATHRARSKPAWTENRTYVHRIISGTPVYVTDGWGADFCAR